MRFGFDTLRDLRDIEALEDAGLLSKEKLLAGGTTPDRAGAVELDVGMGADLRPPSEKLRADCPPNGSNSITNFDGMISLFLGRILTVRLCESPQFSSSGLANPDV
ncbi:hypothetical protein [Mesorhizobium sp. M0276]|uniref:hypothetical protein n=1 Tax=Mesorhizobium sp. M0276 TaxID=2956928 RepID=UPI00333CB528